MKRVFPLTLLVCLLGLSAVRPVQAQYDSFYLAFQNIEATQQDTVQGEADTNTAQEVDPSFLRGSNRALVFDFDLLSLSGLNGGVGAKWWLSSSSALRTTLDLTIQSREDTNGTLSTRGRNSIDFGLTGLIELHSRSFGPTERLSPYLAAGLRFGVGAFSDKTEYPLGNAVQQQQEQGSYIDFTVLAGFGVEYRVARRISLAGEHTFGANVQRQKSDVSETRRDEPDLSIERDTTIFTLGTGTSSLILSVYF